MKKGEVDGFTEIYLSKSTNGDKIVVKRTMAKDGSSKWRLNGALQSAAFLYCLYVPAQARFQC